MSTEDNKTLSRRFLEEFWNQENSAVADELLAANYTYQAPPEWPQGSESLKRLASIYRTAYRKIQVTIEDQIAEGDRVMTRGTWCGTTTKGQVTVSAIFIHRIANGKIVEGWSLFDTLGMLRQLDPASAPGTSYLQQPGSGSVPCGPNGKCPDGYTCMGGYCLLVVPH